MHSSPRSSNLSSHKTFCTRTRNCSHLSPAQPNPLPNMSSDEQEFKPEASANEQAQLAEDRGAEQATAGAALDSEDGVNKENIIDDESGPGGRSKRATRGDPTAAVSCRLYLLRASMAKSPPCNASHVAHSLCLCLPCPHNDDGCAGQGGGCKHRPG